jgi:hypothetical protein
MHLFSFGIDPLLGYLEKRLKGILIASLPQPGPVLAGCPPLAHLEECFKVFGYAADVKPAITIMEKFLVVNNAMTLFENSSGCRLHRDPLENANFCLLLDGEAHLDSLTSHVTT